MCDDEVAALVVDNGAYRRLHSTLMEYYHGETDNSAIWRIFSAN